MFVDGCSRFMCGAIILSVKDPIRIYHHLFRPIFLRCGLFDQIKTDHGQEFCLCVFVQELFKEYRFDKRRTPWLQTPGGVLWTSNDEEVRMGTKIKSQKNSLGLKRTPRNPLDQNDDCTVKRGCPLARFTGGRNNESRITYTKFHFPK